MPDPDHSDIGFVPAAGADHSDLGFVPAWSPEQQTEIKGIRESLSAQPKLGGIIPVKSTTPPGTTTPLEAAGYGALQGSTMQQGQEALGSEMGSQTSVAKSIAQAKEQQPVAYHAANIATSIPSYIATAPVRALRAIQGGIEGYGSAAGKEPLARAGSAATGAMANLVVPEAVSAVVSPIKQWLARKAAGAVGYGIARGGGKVAAAAKEAGELPEIGKELLDKGAAGWTPKGTQEAVGPAKRAVGSSISDALSAVDSHGAPFDGAAAAGRIEQEVRSKLLGEESFQSIRGHLDNLISDLRGKYGTAPFAAVNDFKSRLMKTIGDSKWALSQGTPAQKLMMRSLGILSDEIEQQAGKVAPEASAALSEANASYGRLADAGTMAGITANKKMSLAELLLHSMSASSATAAATGHKAMGIPAAVAEGVQLARKNALPIGKVLHGISKVPTEAVQGAASSALPELSEAAGRYAQPVMASMQKKPPDQELLGRLGLIDGVQAASPDHAALGEELKKRMEATQ